MGFLQYGVGNIGGQHLESKPGMRRCVLAEDVTTEIGVRWFL
jgi:hypothetical protein